MLFHSNQRLLAAVSIITAATLATLSGARADVIIDNLAEPTKDRSEISYNNPLYIDQFAAQAFHVTDSYTLDLAYALLSDGVRGSVPIFEIRTGERSPDTLLTTLVETSFPTGPDEVVTLVPVDAVTLEPGVKYWLVMQVQDGGFFKWAYALGNSWAGPGSFGEYVYSYDVGATWSLFGTDDPFQMAIEGTVVAPPVCYADCDADTVLTIDDFICFQTLFAIEDPYADCDGDTVLTIDDFICFQTSFAIGC